MAALDRVEDALRAHGCAQKGNDWVCPSHADGDPSLSVNEGETGVVMRCHAGCTTEQVLSTLGLKMSDLFNQSLPKPDKKRIIKTYPYVDESGQLLYEVVRMEPKDFRQRTPTSDGKWDWKLNGVRRVLFRLPKVVEAVREGRPVWIVEGEKDVEAFEERGEVATCNSGGAGKWNDDYAQFFKGAEVYIVADNDESGKKHAATVLSSLAPVVGSIETVLPARGKDAAEHFGLGYGVPDFVHASLDSIPSSDETPTGEDSGRKNPMWDKLLATNDIDNLPPPSWILTDFLVNDSVNVVAGAPGACKTWLVMDWGLCIANGVEWMGKPVVQGEVLYVAAEGAATLGPRKKAWQIERGVPAPAGMHWYPEPVNLLDKQAVADLLEVCDALQPLAIIIDTLARSIPGANENESAPMSQAFEAMDEIRRATRAAVVFVHHTPKDGSTPRGHSNLMGNVWTSVLVTKGEDGDVKVEVAKQKHAEEKSITLRLRSVDGTDGAILYEASGFETPERGSMAELQVLDALRLGGAEGLTTNQLSDLSGVPKATFHRVKFDLIANGRMRNMGTEMRPRWVLNKGHSGHSQ